MNTIADITFAKAEVQYRTERNTVRRSRRTAAAARPHRSIGQVLHLTSHHGSTPRVA